MSDSQSFPFESITHPKLWDAAYSAQERYTQLDVAEVVEYARVRGVRVMVSSNRIQSLASARLSGRSVTDLRAVASGGVRHARKHRTQPF